MRRGSSCVRNHAKAKSIRARLLSKGQTLDVTKPNFQILYDV
jgi:hypothetical protein